MSLPLPVETTQRHPLSSRPNSPGANSYAPDLASQSSPSKPSQHGVARIAASQTSTDDVPGASAPRRRRHNNQPTPEPSAALSSSQQDGQDAYDPKWRPQASPSARSQPALRRLESFFGVESAPDHARQASPSTSPSASRRKPAPGTRLVLQHTVAATDTLQGIAISYKTDMQTLRRVNGMWPGDDVLSRKFVWVPLDRCKEMGSKPDSKIGIQGADGQVTETTPSLHLGLDWSNVSSSKSGTSTPTSSILGPSASTTASRGLLAGAASSAASVSEVSEPVSGASGGNMSMPVVRRLPSEVLGHFPAAPRSEVSAKGKERAADEWDQEVTSARPDYRLGPGPGMSGYNPGENGVEDLLQLARKAKLAGSQEDDPATLQTARQGAPAARGISSESCSPSPRALDRSLPDVSAADGELSAESTERWKANVWRVGGGQSTEPSRANRPPSQPSSDLRQTRQLPGLGQSVATTEGSSILNQSIEEWSASSSNVDSRNETSATSAGPSYEGWNDVPSLEAYAKGRVVEAYGKANKKRSARAHHRFIDDLAAGLPANAGTASKWARPIGESVPLPRTPARETAAAAGKGNSLRSLLSDTLRGRLALDEALAKGFEEVLNRSEAWNTLPEEELEHARRMGAWPPAAGSSQGAQTVQGRAQARLSAEEARRSLSTGGTSRPSLFPPTRPDSSSLVASTPPSLEGRRPDALTDEMVRRKSLHEMADLHAETGSRWDGMEASGFQNPLLAVPNGRQVSRKPSSSRLPPSQGKWGW